jgi:transcriptional regulator with PAS, ATPase and Fis domain
LDEIGDLPFNLQTKLLRVLQENEIERIGGLKSIIIDVRIIAATNRNLEKAIKENEFREDLFYRLNVFPINIPPLRERKEDIPLLIKYFMKKYNSKIGKSVEIVSKEVIQKLTDYSWPGNIRELENVIERAIVLSTNNKLIIGDWLKQDLVSKDKEILSLEQLEKQHIEKVLQLTNGRVSGDKGAAKILNINSQTLVSRMKKLGINKD